MKENTAFRRRLLGKDKLLRFVFFLYTLLLLFSIILSCFFSYKRRNDELTLQIDGIFTQLSDQYQSITGNFWQLYMPFFESNSQSQTTLQRYIDGRAQLEPVELIELELLMRQMFLRDQNVKWVVIYGKNRQDNYVLFSESSGLKLLDESFPLWDELKSDAGQMSIYSLDHVSGNSAYENTFAVCGGIPYYVDHGKFFVGYSTASLENICNSATFSLDSISFILTDQGNVLFEHHGSSPIDRKVLYQINTNGVHFLDDGVAVLYRSAPCGSNTTKLTYLASWWEILLYSHSNTPMLIILFLFFGVASIVGYGLILRKMRREVSVIQQGLNEISENNLDHRIDDHFQQDDLAKIAQSINEMAERLNHNINLAYDYEIKQRDAQLSELQSKFNPHFLYNTLEMLRSRCQQNGDMASAKLVTDMSTIFRGLISAKNFVPLSEELAFSRRYLSLFSARYGDTVEIRYAFDRDIMQYGIIKNLFQPLIENYFIHGFDTSNDENYILLKGESLDEKTMLLTVENNGISMSAEEMERLNQQLHEPIKVSTESYGLKNLHQRLALFYGGDCGLTIYPNPNTPQGLSIQMKVLKMTCEEHEALQSKPLKPNTDS